jgi:hypothetical protein
MGVVVVVVVVVLLILFMCITSYLIEVAISNSCLGFAG